MMNNYWDKMIGEHYADNLEDLDKDVTFADLKYLDNGHIYAAIFREIEAECPTVEAVAVYCLKAIESEYYNYMIADRYQAEAYETFDEMYDAGFLDDRVYLAEDIARCGGNPSDHEANPEIYKTVYQHHFEHILVRLNVM